MTKGATRHRGEKDRTVRTRSQLREPQRTQERGVKGSAEAQSRVASRWSQSQFAVRSRNSRSQVTQGDAVAIQTLALRGNECLSFVEVQNGLYTKSLRLSSERSRARLRRPTLLSDQFLRQPNSPMLESHCHVVCDESGLEVASASRLLTSAQRGHSRRRTALIQIFGKSR